MARSHLGKALVLAALVALPTVRSVGAAPAASPIVPAGTAVVLEDAAWSWFEDERITFTADGTSLLLSGVVGTGADEATPGTVALAQLDLADGSRRLVDLGTAEPDDHNSASIHESGSGEITTAWSRHNADRLIRTQRRRTDGSWLRLPAFDLGARTTYSNLRASADAAGQPVLYDFVRGDRFDPEVIASADEGRTWNRLGRLLRDPADSASSRPYVQYSADAGGRIDLIATETHPRNSQTSIYHGFIRGGLLHDSAGGVLGPVGSAVSVTALTPVWVPPATERAWTTDLVTDPITGAPVVLFSVRHTAEDHRYWYATWADGAWAAEEVAPAGGALYPSEEDYTGLAALDPTDARRVVASTSVSPLTDLPLISRTDGVQHWELWDGRRGDDGTWTWSALTADSTEDNLRPVLAAGPGGATALAWLRGSYGSFLGHRTDVVAVVTDPSGHLVPAGAAGWEQVVDVLPAAPAGPAAIPVPGAFDGHGAADVLLVRAGSAAEALYLGDAQRHPTPIAAPSVYGSYVPIAGDFDGDGRDDVLWYGPGATVETLWRSHGTGQFTGVAAPSVRGTYRPVAGDFDGDGRDDVYWHAPGAATDHLWMGTTTGFRDAAAPQVRGTYTPIPGDYDGDQRDDIYWYAPGTTTDHLWMGTTTGFRDAAAPQVRGTYTPIGADLDGDGRSDIHWYRPGAGGDYLWWSAAGPLADSEVAAVDL